MDLHHRTPKRADLQSAAIATLPPTHINGAEGRNRTCYARLFRAALYRLATSAPVGFRIFLAGATGVEPATHGFGDRCSTGLSYTPKAQKCESPLGGCQRAIQPD